MDQAHGDLATLGELDGVGEIVEQGLRQPGGIAHQHRRQIVPLHDEFQALFAHLGADHGDDVVQHAVEGEVGDIETQLARLDLGKVEDVVDDREQVPGGIDDLVQLLLLRGIGIAAPQQVSEPDDRIQGRAYLVAHVGDEGALGRVRRLGCRLASASSCVRVSTSSSR